jgi:hypothetical protein
MKNELLQMSKDYETLILGVKKSKVNKVFPNGFISYGIKRHKGQTIEDLKKQLDN